MHLTRCLATLLMLSTPLFAEPPTTTPAPLNPAAARQLFQDTLHTLETAPHLTANIRRENRLTATMPIADPEHQADVNTVSLVDQTVALERPNRLRLLTLTTPPAQRLRRSISWTKMLISSPHNANPTLHGRAASAT